MRRPSFVPPNALEPLIVVEESFDGDEDDELAAAAAGPPGGEQRDRDRDESPSPPADDVNPYLLSPWRDTRKSSLPTPACASGITASQVRAASGPARPRARPPSSGSAYSASFKTPRGKGRVPDCTRESGCRCGSLKIKENRKYK